MLWIVEAVEVLLMSFLFLLSTLKNNKSKKMKKKNKKHNLQDTRITYKINHLFYYVLQPYYREGNTFVRKSCITKNKCITKQFIPGKFHYCTIYHR